jgi:glutaredoxin
MLALILALQSGFFEEKPVDFWGTKKRAAEAAALWDGARPPAPVADLLENPSAETARRYLDWQRDRLARLQKAVAALEDVQRGRRPEPAREAGEILYFTQEGCPWCEKQDAVLAEMGLRVRRVTRAERDLWKKHGVAATPSLVIPGRGPIVGFHTRRQLEEVLK